MHLSSLFIDEDKVIGHQTFLELTPYVSQTLLDVLKFQKFKLNPQRPKSVKFSLVFMRLPIEFEVSD